MEQWQHKVGDRVPEVTFRLRQDGQWIEKTTGELFAGRAVVVFAVPGAFASACSGRHLPGYVALARNIKRMGIDEIFCIAVNDAFVMNAWAPEARPSRSTASAGSRRRSACGRAAPTLPSRPA
jgi:peroxiredoxin